MCWHAVFPLALPLHVGMFESGVKSLDKCPRPLVSVASAIDVCLSLIKIRLDWRALIGDASLMGSV